MFKEIFSTREAQKDLVRLAMPPELTGLHRAADLPAAELVPFGGCPVNLRYHLFDLSEISPDELAVRTRARAFARFIDLKYVKRRLRQNEVDLIAKATTQINLPEGYRRMKSIADVVIEEGLEKGLEQGLEQELVRGKVDVLIRQLHRLFGITAEEEMIVRSCRDEERLDTAAEVFADENSSKEMVLNVLSNGD